MQAKCLQRIFRGCRICMTYEQLQMNGLLGSASTQPRSRSYRQDSRASLTALREKVGAIVTNVTSGARLQELSEKFARDGLSVKIRPVFSQEAISGISAGCSMTLPRWGIRLAGGYGALATSALRTSGIACSFWRTPTASDGAFSQRTGENLARRWTEQKQKHLSEQVAYLENTGGGQTYRETFLTPTALDGERTKLPNSALASHWIKKGGGTNLAEQIAYRETFPTPCASEAWTSRLTSTQQKEGSRHSVTLSDYIARYPTPQATSWGCTGAREKLKRLEADGEITESERRAMTAGNGGKLNPTWVEWLMGFPIGWTGCDASETR